MAIVAIFAGGFVVVVVVLPLAESSIMAWGDMLVVDGQKLPLLVLVRATRAVRARDEHESFYRRYYPDQVVAV